MSKDVFPFQNPHSGFPMRLTREGRRLLVLASEADVDHDNESAAEAKEDAAMLTRAIFRARCRTLREAARLLRTKGCEDISA